MELSKNAKKLCSVFRELLDEDNFIVVMLILKTEENYSKMLEWLSQNPEAGQEEIYCQLDEMGL